MLAAVAFVDSLPVQSWMAPGFIHIDVYVLGPLLFCEPRFPHYVQSRRLGLVGWFWTSPGADYTDLRGRPVGRRLEVSESAGLDHRTFDQYIPIVLTSAVLAAVTAVDCLLVGWLCTYPCADFTELRCWPAGRRLESSESAWHGYTYLDDLASHVSAENNLDYLHYSPLATRRGAGNVSRASHIL